MKTEIGQEEKRPFWLKIAESDLFSMLNEMGYEKKDVLKFQKKRFFKSLLIFIMSCIAALFINNLLIVLGLILAVFLWLAEYKSVQKKYRDFRFKKQLVFNKFTRLLIPYLLQKGATVYKVLNKMRNRIEDGHVKDALQRLLIGMNEKPNSEEPFRQFAIDASGTDQAILFMTTLYDFQQSTSDTSVIEELGKISSQELFKGVDDIISYKLRGFFMFPTKLTMATLLIVGGYCLATIIETIKSISL
ncbi:hypothetical protein LSG23_20725 (plasmid) [Bacillus velezensis]|uniref:hypothetical protein n=1 Tax=Bacillus velezensis TaxID=492670 RepID=UPI0009880697|nr:hypothetical protein [Bacillus velezensis]AQS42459.1 hypothetical protein BVH55_00240 [Bacillus velezensis]WNR83263.1 hypothetical protein RP314_20605 [Bacillus velezensis]